MFPRITQYSRIYPIKAEAVCSVAIEKCDMYAEGAKTACVKEAKARFSQS